MPALICKMCSGPLKIIEENKLAECIFCRTQYTLPLETDETVIIEKIRPIMHRAEMYLRDHIYDIADNYFEKVLNIMPNCPTAYLGKCLSQYKVTNVYELKEKSGYENNYFLQKAIVFSDEPFRTQLKTVLNLKSQNDSIDNRKKNINSWIKRTLESRRCLIRSMRIINNEASGYATARDEITRKYDSKINSLTSCVDKLQRIYEGKNTILAKIAGMNAEVLYSTEQHYKRIEKDLKRAEDELKSTLEERSNELLSALKEFDDNTEDQYDTSSFSSLQKQYPISPMPDLTKSSITEKIYCICIGTYDFLTFEDIKNHPLCSGYSDKMIKTTLKRLAFDNRVEAEVKDNITYYIPSDILSFFVSSDIMSYLKDNAAYYMT